jgi:hypothetical protein
MSRLALFFSMLVFSRRLCSLNTLEIALAFVVCNSQLALRVCEFRHTTLTQISYVRTPHLACGFPP